MHSNSIKAYHEEYDNLGARAKEILDVFRDNTGIGFTDRGVLKKLPYTDMNAVRPRITELVKDGFLEEVGTIRCQVTNKMVRVCALKTEEVQMQLKGI